MQRKRAEARADSDAAAHAHESGAKAAPVALSLHEGVPAGHIDAPDGRDPMTSGMRFSQLDGIGRARNVNDGDGFMFISHTGEVMPSGFLPVPCGNVRDDDLIEIYRKAPLFRALRDRSQLTGKCGACGFRASCGGSRARAWAMTGDPLAEEPFCAHVPGGLQRTRA